MHAEAPAPLEFWYEFASPYSYIAAMTIEERCAAAGVPLLWKPFLLGPIFALQGWETSHFNLNARRGDYMFHDVARTCRLHGFPYRKPAVFPKPSTLAARAALAIADEPWIGAFTRAVYVANFGDDRAIGDAAVVRAIVADLGRDPDVVLARATGPDEKHRLREQTEAAIAHGIFGAPNFRVAGELFWGEETLDDALAWAHGRR